jgi:hypothetical protein
MRCIRFSRSTALTLTLSQRERGRGAFVLSLPAALLFCCLWTIPVGAAEKNSAYQAALASIKAEDLGEFVGELADPTMEGREAGTRGGKAAGDYLADHYAKLHLQPAGDKGKFFQPFTPNFRNVLAMLPGSDPKLREQVIIVCGHYDHIGFGGRGMSLDAEGDVHPGADDNASGASTVLDLAQAFTVLPTAPKRSILFVNWDAEEKGLLGSKYWAANPTISLKRVVAGLNIDMVGRLRDSRLMVIAARSGSGWRRLLSNHNDGAGLHIDFPWGVHANADHYPLFEHDIPVLLFHTGLHENYHRASDLPKYINKQGMAEITRMVFGVVYELANGPTTPAFRAAARNETPETEQSVLDQIALPGERLGVGWREDAAVAGGVVVSSVAADSPAEHAGVQVGDCIVRIADQKIVSDDGFFAAVAAAANPVAITLKRADEKQPRHLTATLVGSPLRWGMTWRVDDGEPGTVILTHVVHGSPAARAGLAAGDRIYQVGDRDFKDEAAFIQMTGTPAESLPLLIERDGRPRSVTLQSPQARPLKRAA